MPEYHLTDPPSELANHEADTTNVHGIADTSVLVTDSDLATHNSDTTSVHGIADTSVLVTVAQLSAHDSDTTNVHGIADTSVLVTDSDLAAHDSDTTNVHGIADTSELITDSDLAAHDSDTTNVHGIADTARLAKILTASRQSGTATGSGFQTLATIAIPANTLGTNKGVAFEIKYRRTTGAGTVTPRIVYGSTTLVTFSSDSAALGCIRGILFADGATNAQRIHAESSRSTLPVTGTSAEDSTGALNLLVQIDLGTDSDVFTLDWAQAVVME